MQNGFIREVNENAEGTRKKVREITSIFGLSRGVAQRIYEHVGKKRKSVWPILSLEKYSWFTIIDRIYWERNQTEIEV